MIGYYEESLYQMTQSFRSNNNNWNQEKSTIDISSYNNNNHKKLY